MNRMFPPMFNSNNIFGQLFNNIFFDGAINQMFLGNLGNLKSLGNQVIHEDSFDIEIKDCDGYYLIKGFLPDVSARDIRIDFEKNIVILTIRRNQVYQSEGMLMTTIIKTSGNLVKTFYVDEVDKDRIGASFENNLLLLTLPKKGHLDTYNEDKPIIVDVENYIETEKL